MKLKISAVYRPPSHSSFFKNSDLFNQIDLHFPDFSTKIIMGDFNVDMLTQNPHSNIINKFSLKHNLQLVPQGLPTPPPIVLLILISTCRQKWHNKFQSPCINSHFSSLFLFKPLTHPKTQFTLRKIRNIDNIKFKNFLQSQNWSTFYDSEDPEAKLSALNTYLTQALDKFSLW